jgi:hypothetical protein
MFVSLEVKDPRLQVEDTCCSQEALKLERSLSKAVLLG